MIYLLEVSTCWILFYFIYAAFLQKETFFSVNRYYLLGALLAGLFIPYIGSYLPANSASTEVYTVMQSVATIPVAEITPESGYVFSWVHILWSIYVIGALLAMSKTAYGLQKIYSIYKSGTKEIKNNYVLISSKKPHLPFSFFHWVFVSDSLKLNGDIDKIINHEAIHVSQWHSVDILLTEFLQIIFWFNPILVLYKKALRQSHEYLADAYVTKDSEKYSYGQLLLGQSTSGLEIALANQFFNSQIKKRIKMMNTERSNKPAMIKYLAVVPVLAILLMVFSSHISLSGDNSDKKIVEEMENLQVDNNKLQPIGENLQNRNVTSIYLTTDGTTMVNSEKLGNQSLKNLLSRIPPAYVDQERILLISPEPNVQSERIAEIVEIGKELGFISKLDNYPTWKNLNKEPLIVIDGIVKGRGQAIVDKLNPDEIASMKVYKDEAAIKKYGDKGRDGVIEIIMNKTHSFVHGDEVLKVSNEMPRFPGCEDMEGTANEKEDCAKQKMLEFLYMNLKYPKEARDKGIDGMVVIQMIIDKEGAVKDATIVRNIEGGCGEEALRVVNTFPTWIPGRQDGKLVNIQYTLPVRFKLEGDKKEQTKSKETVNTPTLIAQQNNDDEIFKVVEEMPRFPGCEDITDVEEREQCARQKMLTHIYTNIKYPKEAIDKDIQGISVIEFTVTKVGKIKDVKILRDPGAGCGEESQRVVGTMPDFIPGRQSGKAVNVRYVIPVKYKLQGDCEDKEKDMKESKTLDIKGPIISPNPNDGRFNISFETSSESTATINIYGVAGNMIKTVEIKPSNNKVNQQIDISDKSSQIGYVTVIQDGKVYTEMMVNN